MKRHSRTLNTYSGKNAIREYLNPENGPYFPLVELPYTLNPYLQYGVRIFAKLMNATPLMNVKSLPAYNMLKKNKQSSDTMIESSSGNTALSLTLIGRAFGIKNSKVLVSHTIAQDKLKMLKLIGSEVIVNREPMCPDKDDPESSINLAKKWAKDNNWINVGQYDNLDNPESHYKWTGKQIWEQTNGEITVFATNLGTTGTMTGAGSFLKSKKNKIKNIGIVSKEDTLRLGPRTANLLKEISFDWQSVVDHTISVNVELSFKPSLDLFRNGILAGPSSGFTLYGLYQYIRKLISNEELDSVRNTNGEVVCVFVCCDTPFLYIDEYFEHLRDKHFITVKNENLLEKGSTKESKKVINKMKIVSYSCKYVYEKIYNVHESDYLLLDLRKDSDFSNFHIPNVRRANYYEAIENPKKFAKKYAGKKVILIDCGLTGAAKKAATILNSNLIGFLKGGMDKWSKLKYPTIGTKIYG